MTTVKEFKDLGVEFIEGDKCILSGVVFELFGDEGDERFGDAIMKSFTWMPLSTLPDNPRFKYEQDFSQAEIKWRPLLDQSDSKVGEPTKPVFTQEMADAGEFPPVGSKFLYSYIANPKEKDWHEVESKYVDGDCMFFKGSGVVRGFMNIRDMFCSPCKPLDNRTPKQKAVDEIEKVITNEVPTVSVALTKVVIGALIDAGLLEY